VDKPARHRFSQVVSERYLNKDHLGCDFCADVASLIGRVSRLMLAKSFERVDLIGQAGKLVSKTETALKADCFSLQRVLMFSIDHNFLALLRRYRAHLNPTESLS
jgi:hypothetical protein